MLDKIFSIKPAIVITLVTILLFIFSFYYIDHPLTIYVSSHFAHHSPAFWKIISLIFSPHFWQYIIILGFLYVTYRLWQQQEISPKKSILFSNILSILITLILTGLLKHLFGRARPFLLIHNHLSGFYPLMNQYNYYSLPSGHVVIAMAFVCLMFSLSKNILLRLISLVCLCLVVMSRVILLKHFFGDCIVSIGVTLFVFAYRQCIYHIYKTLIQWLAFRLDK